MNITGTETIETEDGRIEVECDETGADVRVYVRNVTWAGTGGLPSTSYVLEGGAHFTFAEWTAVNRAVETFAAALNRKNAA